MRGSFPFDGPAHGRAACPAWTGPRQRRRGRGRSGAPGHALAGGRRGGGRAGRPTARSPSTPRSTRCLGGSRRCVLQRRRGTDRRRTLRCARVRGRRPDCWSTARRAESATSWSSAPRPAAPRPPRCAGPERRSGPIAGRQPRRRLHREDFAAPARPTTWSRPGLGNPQPAATCACGRGPRGAGAVRRRDCHGQAAGARNRLGDAPRKVAALFLKLKLSVPTVAAARRPSSLTWAALGRGRDRVLRGRGSAPSLRPKRQPVMTYLETRACPRQGGVPDV